MTSLIKLLIECFNNILDTDGNITPIATIKSDVSILVKIKKEYP